MKSNEIKIDFEIVPTPTFNGPITVNKGNLAEPLFLSKDTTWTTPKKWFEYLDLEFGFTLDPCCFHETALCEKHFTPEENGLKQSWEEERVFMNPPYGREIKQWMKKAYEEARMVFIRELNSSFKHSDFVKAKEAYFAALDEMSEKEEGKS